MADRRSPQCEGALAVAGSAWRAEGGEGDGEVGGERGFEPEAGGGGGGVELADGGAEGGEGEGEVGGERGFEPESGAGGGGIELGGGGVEGLAAEGRGDGG